MSALDGVRTTDTTQYEAGAEEVAGATCTGFERFEVGEGLE